MSFICMTYIGVGADLKPVNIYTERSTHMSSTIYHAKNLESQCLSPTNLEPKSLNRDPNNLKHKSLEIQSLKHANNLKANNRLTYTDVK